MKQWKPFFFIVSLVVVTVVMIPTLMVIPFSVKQDDSQNNVLKEPGQRKEKSPMNEPHIKVYRAKSKQVENVPLEEYVAGVVAAEMPADFELEALKAQALTARTFIVKMMYDKGNDSSIPEGSDITDTVTHQVYSNKEELKAHWGSQYERKMSKIKQAVNETRGQLLTYEGKPITASFFSTSNGFTENSEDYWANALPYLRSVKSPWDKKSPKYLHEKTVKIHEFERLLQVKLGKGDDVGEILSRTKGNRVGEIQIGGKRLTGKKVREVLNLQSSDFTWYRMGNHVVITTKGFGHGVGMSQYGANGMAKDGKNYRDIVSHYYKGVAISEATAYLPTLTAGK